MLTDRGEKERCNCDASCGENRYHDKGDAGCIHQGKPTDGLTHVMKTFGRGSPTEVKPTPFNVESIRPPRGEMDGRGKFSPNLYRWLIKKWARRFGGHGMEQPPLVYRDKDGTLWIGSFKSDDTGGWFSGARLMRVLSVGASAQIFAIVPKQTADFKPVPNFWRAYIRIGRCAIDKDHNQFWINDEYRWSPSGKNKRHCVWCGKHTQRRRVRTRTIKTREERWEQVK